MFSSKSFIVSSLTFTSLIHCEFTFVHGVKECSNFILSHVAVQFSQHRLLKRLSFLHCMVLSLADSNVSFLVSGPCCKQRSSPWVKFSLLCVSLLHSTHQLVIRFGGSINSMAASGVGLQAQRRQGQHLLVSWPSQGLHSRSDASSTQ